MYCGVKYSGTAVQKPLTCKINVLQVLKFTIIIKALSNISFYKLYYASTKFLDLTVLHQIARILNYKRQYFNTVWLNLHVWKRAKFLKSTICASHDFMRKWVPWVKLAIYSNKCTIMLFILIIIVNAYLKKCRIKKLIKIETYRRMCKTTHTEKNVILIKPSKN